MAYPDIDIDITDAGDSFADEQDILFGPAGANPPTNALVQNEPLSTAQVTATAVEPGTYYAQRVIRNSSTGEEASTTPVEVVVEGPAITWSNPGDGGSLEDGDSVTLLVEVAANAHAGAGVTDGIDGILFQYSTDGGSTWTDIGTAVCDDTSTPEASVAWTVATGADALRAVCVDPTPTEIGTSEEIAVTVTTPTVTVFDADLSSITQTQYDSGTVSVVSGDTYSTDSVGTAGVAIGSQTGITFGSGGRLFAGPTSFPINDGDPRIYMRVSFSDPTGERVLLDSYDSATDVGVKIVYNNGSIAYSYGTGTSGPTENLSWTPTADTPYWIRISHHTTDAPASVGLFVATDDVADPTTIPEVNWSFITGSSTGGALVASGTGKAAELGGAFNNTNPAATIHRILIQD